MKWLKFLLLLSLLPVSAYAADDLSFAANPPAYIGIKLFIIAFVVLFIAPFVLLFERGIKISHTMIKFAVVCFVLAVILIPLSCAWDKLL